MNLQLPPQTVVTARVAAPSNPQIVYVGTRPAGVLASRDGGVSWSASTLAAKRWWKSPASPGFVAFVMALAVSPADPDTVVAGVEAGAVVLSTDGARSWSGHRPGAIRDCHALAFHPRHAQHVYEAGGYGAARSNDGGRTWKRTLWPRYCFDVAVDPADPELWYVCTSPGPSRKRASVLRSRRGRWEPLDVPSPSAIGAPAANELEARLADGRVLRSTDAGETWA